MLPGARPYTVNALWLNLQSSLRCLHIVILFNWSYTLRVYFIFNSVLCEVSFSNYVLRFIQVSKNCLWSWLKYERMKIMSVIRSEISFCLEPIRKFVELLEIKKKIRCNDTNVSLLFISEYILNCAWASVGLSLKVISSEQFYWIWNWITYNYMNTCGFQPQLEN